jgi:repressor LexA
VLVNGNDATVKKLVKHENGISLIAFNGKYDPMFYTPKEVAELPVSILGKVVELRGKF